MAQKRDQRQQKKREKTKSKRKDAQKERREKGMRRVGGKGAALEKARSWPLGPAWLSANWYERGAHVHAVITRKRSDGRFAAAIFEVDLAEQGVVAAKAGAGYTEERVLGEVGHRSEPEGMIEVEPRLAAKVVLEGLQFGEARGHPHPHKVDEALGLFADLDLDDYAIELLFGREPEPEPDTGWVASVKRFLFGGPRPLGETAEPGPDEDVDEADAPTEKSTPEA